MVLASNLIHLKRGDLVKNEHGDVFTFVNAENGRVELFICNKDGAGDHSVVEDHFLESFTILENKLAKNAAIAAEFLRQHGKVVDARPLHQQSQHHWDWKVRNKPTHYRWHFVTHDELIVIAQWEGLFPEAAS